MAQEGKIRALVISDGRRGIENQALGLSEAMSQIRPLAIKTHIIENKGLFAKSTPAMQFALKSNLSDYGLSDMSALPSIAIGCGRQAIAPLRALKAAYGSDIFTVYIQSPRTDLSYFDLIIAPQHDQLSGANVETMIGSPNRVSVPKIAGETLIHGEALLALPTPRAAVLIGGPSKSRTLSRQTHDGHLGAMRALSDQGVSLMITTSRRTPDWALADYKRLESDCDHVWLHTGAGPNPYFAFLGGADFIFVTEESTNMLTEACATGKPVYRLAMDGKPGKFSQLYSALETRCAVTPFDVKHNNIPEGADYPPLDETARIAARVWAHIDARSATIN